MIDTITKIYDKSFPVRTVRISSTTATNPWITPGILKSIKRKKKLYRAKLKKSSSKNIQNFRKYRNKLNHLISSTKKEYYKALLNRAQGNIRSIWKAINEIINRKKAQPKNISCLAHNNKRYTKTIDIAATFNIYFTNVGPTLAKQISNDGNACYKDWLIRIQRVKDLTLPEISQLKVLDELYSLDPHKAVGNEGIPVVYIKKAAEFISQPLSYIFNTSISLGIFPDEMKIAKVISLFKSGDHELVSNYRPISLLPTFSKVFEKIVCEILSTHLDKNHLLFYYQFGFRKKCNSTLAILDFVQRITDAIDNGNISLGVFLDLSKAFDTVSHSILLDKLSHYSLSENTLRWFENYLKDRKQYVCIDGINSCSRTISYGLP